MGLLTLKQIAEKSLKKESILPSQILHYKETVKLHNVASTLWYDNVNISIFELSNKNFIEAKKRFFYCGWLDEYCVKKNSRFLDYGLQHVSYAILSDNEDLIQRYAKLRYQRGVNAELSMDEMVAIGELPIWCNTVQFFMANDTVKIERNLNIIETSTLPKLPKKEEGLKDDYEFYKALYTGDKLRMEEILEKLVSPKIHKKRNDNPILNQYISLPALGYAKLAWRKGIEVEVNSPLVPRELLPVQPLEHYEIPYDFLKEGMSK
jgi:pyruvate formate-lyase activating enzyme-like uncharacterized protein